MVTRSVRQAVYTKPPLVPCPSFREGWNDGWGAVDMTREKHLFSCSNRFSEQGLSAGPFPLPIEFDNAVGEDGVGSDCHRYLFFLFDGGNGGAFGIG